MNQESDYTVRCRCGWMGKVSALRSLPEFKWGCPECSAEFTKLDTADQWSPEQIAQFTAKSTALPPPMNELQQARADWIKAQERILELEKDRQRLTVENFELQMKLHCAEGQAAIMKGMHEGFVAGLLGIRR